MFNPEIIKSRYYQQKWEESVNTLLTACRKSIIDYLYMQYNLLNPYHTCSNNWEMFDFQDCNQCVDDQYFNSSLNKLYNIEQELWINYFSYKSSAQSLSKSFDKYMYENSCVSFFDEGLKPNEMVNEGYLLDHLSNDATNLDIPYIDDYQVLSNPSNINTTTINEETFISSTQSKLKFQVKKENNRTNIATVKPEVKKVKLPFLKDFVIKFTKRENIDKAILRKFRKYIKEKSKKKLINFDEESSVFWKYFVFENLFPPMKYIENNEVIEFKSFNTTYMMWLLSHKGSSDLYEIFLKENYQPLYQYFIKKFNIMLPEEKDQVSFYLCNLVKIFTSIDSIEETNNVETECVPIREDTKNMINPYLNHATSSMFENDFDMLNEAFNINMGVEVSPPVYGKNNLPKIYHNSFENSEDLGSMFNNSYHGEKNNLYGDD